MSRACSKYERLVRIMSEYRRDESRAQGEAESISFPTN